MTLSRYVDGADEVITQMAQLLVQLVNLTPQGMANLRATDPDHALVLLQEGETFLPIVAEMAEAYRKAGYERSGARSTTSRKSTSSPLSNLAPRPPRRTDTQVACSTWLSQVAGRHRRCAAACREGCWRLPPPRSRDAADLDFPRLSARGLATSSAPSFRVVWCLNRRPPSCRYENPGVRDAERNDVGD